MRLFDTYENRYFGKEMAGLTSNLECILNLLAKFLCLLKHMKNIFVDVAY